MSLILDGTAGVTGPATKVIVGTTTNDSATAGYVGEYVEGVLAAGSATALTTATPQTLVSISLTAGDWDVTGMVGVQPNPAATYSYTIGSVSRQTTHKIRFKLTGLRIRNILPEHYLPLQQTQN
jgi:hypothetical protein